MTPAAGLGAAQIRFVVGVEPAEFFPALRRHASMTATSGRRPTVQPSAGGSLPNDVFSELLELPTVWVPHSYRGCSQHAPNEHLPTALACEALLMAGI